MSGPGHHNLQKSPTTTTTHHDGDKASFEVNLKGGEVCQVFKVGLCSMMSHAIIYTVKFYCVQPQKMSKKSEDTPVNAANGEDSTDFDIPSPSEKEQSSSEADKLK